MITIDVELIPQGRKYDVAVAVDVLRMTTTAATLFSRGLSRLHVVAELTDARELAARNKDSILIAERGGRTVEGCDGGNSPLEYASLDLVGRQAVLCTTNGSKAVAAASDSNHLLLGAVVNAAACAQAATNLASESITVVCAATDGEISFDDVTGAGCLVHEMLTLLPDARLTDAAKLAYSVLGSVEHGARVPDAMLLDLLRHSDHARLLENLGQSADIDFAAGLNRLPVAPQRMPDVGTAFSLMQ